MWGLSTGIAVVTITLWLIWRKKKYSFFKELGIPGPEPSIFFGNLWELRSKGPLECHKKWIEQYGKIVGYYFGARPIILVSDTELLKKIQVSDFHKFVNRPALFQISNPRSSPFSKNLTSLRDKRWKEIRSIITPSFTTSKMKLMAPAMNNAIDVLLENIEEKSRNNETFDIYTLYKGLTMDVIGRTAFGIQTNVQKNPKDPFLKSIQVLLSGNLGLLTVISSGLLLNEESTIQVHFQAHLNVLISEARSANIDASFPELRLFWLSLRQLRMFFQNEGKSPITELVNAVSNVISTRRTDNSAKRTDLLQLMIDAEMSESELKDMKDQNLTAGDEEMTDEASKEADGVTKKQTSKGLRHMTDSEIVANTLLFFIAGYETTSTALAFSTHLLLHHPEVQEKIREEVNDLIEKEGAMDYTSVHKLQYLDKFFRESLRMYPPIYLFINRETGEDVTFGNIRIPKGCAIQAPVFALHHDPELWSDPEKFDPERFSPENRYKHHPMAWQPFGAGPRNCVGMRFAQMEAKLALAKILQTYKLVKTEETDKDPATLRVSAAIIRPANGVKLRAVRH